MSKREKRAATRVESATRRLVEAYLRAGAEPWWPPGREAEAQVDNLAMHDPETFWQFLLLLLERRPGLTDLVHLGGALTWLLRYHPDQFDERVAGLARREQQMRDVLSSVDPNRIAPDVWAKIDTAIREADAAQYS
ncbi:MAG: DUF6869 domain-containing protein [Pseudomonadota bacterium]